MPNAASSRLEARGLTCVRAGRTLFHNLDLRVEPGQIVQIEGENGAGKTSLLRILCGLTLPREGSVFWGETDILWNRAEYYQALLYIGHLAGIKEELTPLENLRFLHALQSYDGGDAALEQALDTVGLFGYEDTPVRALSAGQRRRVALARLWLSSAPLWLLDEPFTAIDQDGIRRLENRLQVHIGAGGMVVLTSHQTLNLPPEIIRRLRLQ